MPLPPPCEMGVMWSAVVAGAWLQIEQSGWSASRAVRLRRYSWSYPLPRKEGRLVFSWMYEQRGQRVEGDGRPQVAQGRRRGISTTEGRTDQRHGGDPDPSGNARLRTGLRSRTLTRASLGRVGIRSPSEVVLARRRGRSRTSRRRVRGRSGRGRWCGCGRRWPCRSRASSRSGRSRRRCGRLHEGWRRRGQGWCGNYPLTV